jgi:hypothetical protein
MYCEYSYTNPDDLQVKQIIQLHHSRSSTVQMNELHAFCLSRAECLNSMSSGMVHCVLKCVHLQYRKFVKSSE